MSTKRHKDSRRIVLAVFAGLFALASPVLSLGPAESSQSTITPEAGSSDPRAARQELQFL